MLDLGRSLLASVERSPGALAIVDGAVRLDYAAWLGRILRLVGALDRLGLRPGDHLVTALQNRWEAATLHWACQFAGLVMTPLNWRARADEIDYCIQDCDARVLVYEAVSSAAVAESGGARGVTRI